MNTQYPYMYVGTDALNELWKFCQKQHLDRFVLVTDENIHPVWGEPVLKALHARGARVESVILKGDHVTPDEHYIIRILLESDDQPSTYLSVGSGTLTDIVRFVAHRTKSNFISLPTAPSMDGYASSGSALTLNKMKQTVQANPPIAILADLPTLCQAPRELISAGFGDVFGKFTALADWSLGALIINDSYSAAIADRVKQRLLHCASLMDQLDDNWDESIEALMDALLDVGLCMLETGNSRPASGAEHSCSHFWEMKLMSEGRPVSLHGIKVGFATALIAERYAWLREMPVSEVRDRLAVTPMPNPDDEICMIQKIYGPIADDVVRTQKFFLELTPDDYEAIKNRIEENWSVIQSIAASVPTTGEVTQLLEKAGIPTNADEIGLTPMDVHEALYYGHYLRNPFSVIKLLRMLGVDLVEGV